MVSQTLACIQWLPFFGKFCTIFIIFIYFFLIFIFCFAINKLTIHKLFHFKSAACLHVHTHTYPSLRKHVDSQLQVEKKRCGD